MCSVEFVFLKSRILVPPPHTMAACTVSHANFFSRVLYPITTWLPSHFSNKQFSHTYLYTVIWGALLRPITIAINIFFRQFHGSLFSGDTANSKDTSKSVRHKPKSAQDMAVSIMLNKILVTRCKTQIPVVSLIYFSLPHLFGKRIQRSVNHN